LFGDNMKLVQTSAFQFAHEGANVPTVVFAKNEEGKNIMVMDGAWYEQKSYFAVKLPFFIAVITLLFAVFSILPGVLSLIGFARGKLKWNQFHFRILPMLAVLLLVWAVLNLLQVQDESYLLSELTKIDARTIIVFSGTLLFGVFSLLHLILAAQKFKQFKNRLFAFYWLVTALSICYISFVLFQNGWIGLRTWTM
jgi:hypothetical protein